MSKSFDKDKGYKELMTRFELNDGKLSVNIGFLRSSAFYAGKDNITVAQVAAINEFGSNDGHVPERSFMRSSIDANKKQIERLLNKLSGKCVDGTMTPKKALGLVGEFVKSKMVSKINAGVPPDNAESTIARKGSSKPLIDTGQLKNSIDWEVSTKQKVKK